MRRLHRANAPEDVKAARRLRAQTRVKVVRSSATPAPSPFRLHGESRRRRQGSTDASQVDYALMVATLDSFIGLFAPFTWLPTLAWAGWVDCSLPGHEEEEQGRGRRQGFLPPISKKGVPMIMEPLVYLLVTATTLTRHLAYLRQAMAMLHVVYASISILLDMGGARLIRDLGGIIST